MADVAQVNMMMAAATADHEVVMNSFDALLFWLGLQVHLWDLEVMELLVRHSNTSVTKTLGFMGYSECCQMPLRAAILPTPKIFVSTARLLVFQTLNSQVSLKGHSDQVWEVKFSTNEPRSYC